MIPDTLYPARGTPESVKEAEWKNLCARTFLAGLLLCALSACDDKDPEKKPVSAQDRESKAQLLCKHDRGLREIVEFDGSFFTAKCQSGIVVSSVVD